MPESNAVSQLRRADWLAKQWAGEVPVLEHEREAYTATCKVIAAIEDDDPVGFYALRKLHGLEPADRFEDVDPSDRYFDVLQRILHTLHEQGVEL